MMGWFSIEWKVCAVYNGVVAIEKKKSKTAGPTLGPLRELGMINSLTSTEYVLL